MKPGGPHTDLRSEPLGHARPVDTHPAARNGAAVLTLGVVVLVLVVSVFFSLPSNVLAARDGGALRTVTVRLLPQSWAFFTKPPNDPEVVPYRVHADGELEFVSLLPNSRSENYYGLTRRQRAQGPELANLYNQVEHWVDCEAEQGDCLDIAVVEGDPLRLVNSSKVPTLCGELLLVETTPVPWAFRHDYSGWRLERRVALVEARCS